MGGWGGEVVWASGWVIDLPSGSLTDVVGASHVAREEGGGFDGGPGDQRCCVCQEGDGQGGNAHDGLPWGMLREVKG